MNKLLKAAEKGDANKVAKFIKKGADVNFSDNVGWTPLFRAAQKGHVEVVKMLLDAGAEIEKTTSGITPLCWAADSGKTDVVKLLLERGANVNAIGKKNAPALYHAADIGYKDLVKVLLENGAHVNAQTEDEYRWTPLHVAVSSRFSPYGITDHEKNRAEVVSLLLDFGADVSIPEDTNGFTALHLACQVGRSDLVEMLLDHNAEINAIDNNGMTPLLWAAAEEKMGCVQILLDRGADANMRHPETNLSPYEMAMKFNNPLIANLIEKYGGK